MELTKAGDQSRYPAVRQFYIGSLTHKLAGVCIRIVKVIKVLKKVLEYIELPRLQIFYVPVVDNRVSGARTGVNSRFLCWDTRENHSVDESISRVSFERLEFVLTQLLY